MTRRIQISTKILEVGETVVVGVFYANTCYAFSSENQELLKTKMPENGLDKPFLGKQKTDLYRSVCGRGDRT